MSLLSKIKQIRPEFIIAGVFAIILILYSLYTLILYLLSGNSIVKQKPFTSTNTESSSNMTEQKSSINEAVSSDRPITISASAMEKEFDSIIQSSPEVSGMEVATQSSNPTVWVYIKNNGTRQDELAVEYCKILHSKRIMAKRVTILDEAARNKGKIVEIGDSNCDF